MNNYKIIPFVDVSKQHQNKYSTMDRSHVADAHLWTFDNRQMNFNKDLKLKGKYCHHPFNTITVDGEGDVYLCICQAWLPISVGKIWEFESLTDIVLSPKALEIQTSIIDGTYKYCDHTNCSIIKEDGLGERIDDKYHTVNWINFAVDNSCNLTCPSCRKEFLFENEGEKFNLKIKIINHLIKLIERHHLYLKFTLSGDGDPFASLVYRHLLYNLNLESINLNDGGFGINDPLNDGTLIPITNPEKIKNNPTLNLILDLRQKLFEENIERKIEIELVTNGVLLKDHWHKLSKIHKNIVRTKLSFDAGSEEVYNITRRGGDWDKLLDSSKFISAWKQKTSSDMILTANFVVQTYNYKDMPAYVELCDQLGFDEINFQKIADWGTFDNFKEHAVWQLDHPEHKDFLSVLEHPNLNNKKINFTNLK